MVIVKVVTETADLLALPNFDDFVGYIAVSLTVNRLSGLFVGSAAQAENRAFCFVVPVAQKFNPVLLLNLQILLMGFRKCLASEALSVPVDIHVKRH